MSQTIQKISQITGFCGKCGKEITNTKIFTRKLDPTNNKRILEVSNEIEQEINIWKNESIQCDC